ncbi:MAG: dihydroxyacetone kinase subunit L, partial [Selenomonas sp.]|nr:dihydroxyacetone kinase subunit L [Selenomonas sp.]
LAELPGDAPVQDVLHHIGRAFIENVGGAAGPLYGIAFVRAGEAVNAKTRLDVASFEKLFTAGIEAIQRRGRAEYGDKTMLDALIPIRDAFRSENADGKSLRECLEDALDAGRAGAEYTKTIAARRGRAAIIGERSIGVEDPGAMSSLIMFRALCSYLRG